MYKKTLMFINKKCYSTIWAFYFIFSSEITIFNSITMLYKYTLLSGNLYIS